MELFLPSEVQGWSYMRDVSLNSTWDPPKCLHIWVGQQRLVAGAPVMFLKVHGEEDGFSKLSSESLSHLRGKPSQALTF